MDIDGLEQRERVQASTAILVRVEAKRTKPELF